jgi:NTP pyrophosphatase (non-canonical NTP hydrolase)
MNQQDDLVHLVDVLRIWHDWRKGLARGAFSHSYGLKFVRQLDDLLGSPSAVALPVCRVCETSPPAAPQAPAGWQEMSFRQFSVMNRTRCEDPKGFNHQLSGWSTSDWFVAIMGELGEAANIAKKLNRARDGVPGKKEPVKALRDKLRKELGDTFVYLDLIAQSLGFFIGDAAVEVFDAKSREIGYPLPAPAPETPK